MVNNPETKPEAALADRLETIAVHEEQLHVDVRPVDTGRGVRIHTVVAEHPVHIDELLAHDAFTVTHVPVGTFVDDGAIPAPRQEGDTLVIPVMEEVLVVERRLRIKEELRVTRVRHEERHVETVLLKSEEIHVERFDDAARS